MPLSSFVTVTVAEPSSMVFKSSHRLALHEHLLIASPWSVSDIRGRRAEDG